MIRSWGQMYVPGLSKTSTSANNTVLSLKSLNTVMVMKGKAMVFPVVMYGCDSWTVRKAEH